MGKKKKARRKKNITKGRCIAVPVSGGYSCSSESVTVGDWDTVSASLLSNQNSEAGDALYLVETSRKSVYGQRICLMLRRLGDLVWFADKASHAQVLNGDPYFVCGKPLLLKNMPKYFAFGEDDIHYLPVWIQLPGLPLECCNPSTLCHIASMVDYISVGHSSTNCKFSWTDLSSTPARRQPRSASGLQSKRPASFKNVETEMHWKSGQNATPKQDGALNASDHNLSQNKAEIEQLSINPPNSQHVDNGKSGESDVFGDAMLSSAAELTSKATRSKDPQGNVVVVDPDVQVIIPPINSSLRRVELDN